jgi:YVTN family beta-propeller protein
MLSFSLLERTKNRIVGMIVTVSVLCCSAPCQTNTSTQPNFIYHPLIASSASVQAAQQPIRDLSDPGVVPTRQVLTPAGMQSVFSGRLYGVAFDPSGDSVWVLTPPCSVYQLNWKENKVERFYELGKGGIYKPGLQGIRYDGNSMLVSCTYQASEVNESATGVRLFWINKGSVRSFDAGAEIPDHRAPADYPAYDHTPGVAYNPGHGYAGPIGLAKNASIALVPLTYRKDIAVIDTAHDRVLRTVQTGIAPFAVAVNASGTVAYVTNWGGRIAKRGDLTMPMGPARDADALVVDKRGIAASGTVSRVDVASGQVSKTIQVGLHPSALVWNQKTQLLYIANGNSDSISVVDTAQDKVIRTIPLQPFEKKTTGLAPTALALTPDGERLLVACGGINAIAIIHLPDGSIEGMIPTAWYPDALDISPDGHWIAVSSLLGRGTGSKEKQPTQRWIGASRGSVNLVGFPKASELAQLTLAVAANNHLALRAQSGIAAVEKPNPNAQPLPVPFLAGEPSLIDHVVLIIKENRTYDQVFGDLARGDGDPSLVMFGKEITPNHHAIAEQFAIFDNFYANGGVSADGHQWVTQANANDYVQWDAFRGRSNPFDGDDPMAFAPGGFLWDGPLRHNKTVRVYGEFAGLWAEDNFKQSHDFFERWKNGESFQNEFHTRTPLPALTHIFASNYPAYTSTIPDVVRARIFLADVKRWGQEGAMPNLCVLSLPNDHTLGTTPGAPTPQASVADNDYALGQIVEGLTHSPFWNKMAIVVVEDDAAAGVDHVDGHRTVALAISPYMRRKAVDSTFYSQVSMVKTINLILGSEPLSVFELIANDMRAAFTTTPDFTPYIAVEPSQSISDINPPLRALHGPAMRGAMASIRMRFDVPDEAPPEVLNPILWHAVRGWNVPYPRVRQSVFGPPFSEDSK